MEFTTHLELHSQATRLKRKLNPQSDDNHTGLSPSMGNWSRIPTDLGCTTNCRKWASQTPHSQTPIKSEGFSAGLFPFRSPLLGESFLVSFPPLNDMLKFSGWSCPIWGLRLSCSPWWPKVFSTKVGFRIKQRKRLMQHCRYEPVKLIISQSCFKPCLFQLQASYSPHFQKTSS